ncbi:DUF6744 family protein [Lentzea chajnantorensis]
MSTQAATTAPSRKAGSDALSRAFDVGDAPLLGHLVMYSVYDAKVTPAMITQWFGELGLDTDFLPPDLRASDAYEKVTGPSGVKATYALDDPTANFRDVKQRNKPSNLATLMIRLVRKDGGQIVHHVVREVRNEVQSKLTYDPLMAELTFKRDNEKGAAEGAGSLEIRPYQGAIKNLPPDEQDRVRKVLEEIKYWFDYRRTYLDSDKLRKVVRNYLEHLKAVMVRPGGGVYFVHAQHAETIAALHELVKRFGGMGNKKSSLTRIPLLDQEEMREMVIEAFTSKAAEELEKLAEEIAAAKRDGAKAHVIEKLYARFRELKASTEEHSTLLSTSLDDTTSALELVQLQLSSLLMTADAED